MTDADVLDVTVDMIWCIIKCSFPDCWTGN